MSIPFLSLGSEPYFHFQGRLQTGTDSGSFRASSRKVSPKALQTAFLDVCKTGGGLWSGYTRHGDL